MTSWPCGPGCGSCWTGASGGRRCARPSTPRAGSTGRCGGRSGRRASSPCGCPRRTAAWAWGCPRPCSPSRRRDGPCCPAPWWPPTSRPARSPARRAARRSWRPSTGELVEWLDAADVVHGDVTGAVRLRSADPLTPLHRVPAAGGPGAAAGSADPVAVLLTAAEQLGTAGRVCELAVAYARRREQFGRAIGAFQAVQHLCADLLVRAETARAAVYAAAVTADPADIAAARLLADEAAVHGARDCLQVHGGMGFTWEADVHLHLKRAWVRAERAGGAPPVRNCSRPRWRAEPPGTLWAPAPGKPWPTMSRIVANWHHGALIPGCVLLRDSSRPGVGGPLGYLVWDASGRAYEPCRRCPLGQCRTARCAPLPCWAIGVCTPVCSTPRHERRTVCLTRTPSRGNMPEALVGVTVRQPCCLARESQTVTPALAVVLAMQKMATIVALVGIVAAADAVAAPPARGHVSAGSDGVSGAGASSAAGDPARPRGGGPGQAVGPLAARRLGDNGRRAAGRDPDPARLRAGDQRRGAHRPAGRAAAVSARGRGLSVGHGPGGGGGRQPRAPVPSCAGDDATGGRGLALVDCLADRWGWSHEGAGKNIWCELDRCSQPRESAATAHGGRTLRVRGSRLRSRVAPGALMRRGCTRARATRSGCRNKGPYRR